MRVGLIACSKTKLDHAAPAEELYQGHVFKLARAWMLKHLVNVPHYSSTGQKAPPNEWGILSAKHGLLMPDQVIEPYDLALTDLKAGVRKAWEEQVYRQLMERWGDDVIYRVLAGYNYREPVKRMPMCEDVIDCWTQWRIGRGMKRSRAGIGIGVLKRILKEDWNYG